MTPTQTQEAIKRLTRWNAAKSDFRDAMSKAQSQQAGAEESFNRSKAEIEFAYARDAFWEYLATFPKKRFEHDGNLYHIDKTGQEHVQAAPRKKVVCNSRMSSSLMV